MLSKNNPSVDNIITFCNNVDDHDDVEAGKQDLFCNSDEIEYQEIKIYFAIAGSYFRSSAGKQDRFR